MNIDYKQQVVLGRDGSLAIATPLFMLNEAVEFEKLEGHAVVMARPEILGYALEFDDGSTMLVNAKVLTDRCEFLGDL